MRADVGKLNAELVTGVAVGSGSNGGKRQTPAESAPPSSEAHRRPSMRRPSGLEGSYVAAESEAEQKERTKKQLESITGRMFQVSCGHPLSCMQVCIGRDLFTHTFRY